MAAAAANRWRNLRAYAIRHWAASAAMGLLHWHLQGGEWILLEPGTDELRLLMQWMSPKHVSRPCGLDFGVAMRGVVNSNRIGCG